MDICLSASAFHQETWQPAWTVRTLVSALRAHMATKVRGHGVVGGGRGVVCVARLMT